MSTETDGNPDPASVVDRLAPFSRPRFAIAMAVLSVAALVIFSAIPAIDIAVARAFFHAGSCAADAPAGSTCGGFPLASIGPWTDLRKGLRYLPVVAAGGVIAAMIWNHRRRSWGTIWQKAALLLLASVALSSLLITDTVLKEIWGRPRPWQTELFGGTLPFVAAGRLGGQCVSNCSFVSSESAAAFWVVCLVVLLPGRWRTAGYAATLSIAMGTAALRVAFGAHFLSDVVLAGLLAILVFSLMASIVAPILDRQAAEATGRTPL